MANWNGEAQTLQSYDEEAETLQRFREVSEFFLKNSGEGKILFKSGVKNNWHWRTMCYASQNFRAFYALETFQPRAQLVSQAFITAVDRNIVPRDYFRDIHKVAAFGCGPASELWGFKKFLIETFAYSYKINDFPRFTGYDSELGWMPFVEALDFKFLCKEINVKFLEEVMPQDVIIMSYFAKAAKFVGDSEETKAKWDAIEKKANFIMVLEVKDSKLHDLLTARGYKNFALDDPLQGNETQLQVYCLLQSEFSLLTRRRGVVH